MPQRLTFVDALRGYALFGVFGANLLIFSGFVYMTGAQQATVVTTVSDRVAEVLELLFIETKFMSLFSFLFGISFWLFLDRARARGGSATALFYRRIGWLFVCGALHGWLLWCFDILRFYALWALLLPLFVRTPLRRLMPALKRVFVAGAIAGVIGNIVFAAHMLEQPRSFVLRFLQEFIVESGFLGLTLAYASGFALLFINPRWRPRVSVLAPLGQMALTFYLLQTLFGIWLFYGFAPGRHLMGRIGPAALAVICVVGYALQLGLAHAWMRRFRFGPAEWLWRTLTYGRAQPLRVAAAAVALLAVVLVAAPTAQPVFRGDEIFPPEEFAARRAKVMEKIGDGVAIVLGTPGPPGEMPFRQNSQFFYLTGATEPRASVIIDGRLKKTTIYLQPTNERRDASMFGPALAPGPGTAAAIGVDAALPAGDFTAAIAALAGDRRTIYTPFAAEVLGSQSQGDPTRFWAANKADPWDGRDSREAAFLAKLKIGAPQSEIANLDPILNALRAVKSPREIAVIREATRIAGLGIMEAMRDARPGMHEYELQADAEFVFKKLGAIGPSYFALIATGENTYYTHYNRNTAVLKAGDLVQFDYAPDYKYYQSDVTRVFPANGTFTPRQREYYGIYLRLYQALMTSIGVHKRPIDVIADAVTKMDAIVASYPFTDDRIKGAAAKFVDGFRSRREANGLGHNVGLEVHDPGGLQAATLEPGRVFTIEPMMRIEEEHVGIRLEDMILITEGGYENLSRSVPIEVNDIEKLMAQPGLSEKGIRP